jgi:GNAT superfamily N-acetyltransferase
MIRDCRPDEFDTVLRIVNDGAAAYRGVIPEDRWHDPYMSADELRREIAAGVAFRGWQDDGAGLLGVMGAQPAVDVLLIRHAYVRTAWHRQGIGSRLIEDLLARAHRPVLVGTWAAASWAVAFYERHGFTVTPDAEKSHLLRTYWTIPERQIETSVVLRYGG